MNCRNCGYEFAETAADCPQCGCLKTEESSKASSTLIEFPVSSRLQGENGVLDWRAEISAKVRAAKANRIAQDGGSPRVSHSSTSHTGAATGAAVALAGEPKLPFEAKSKNEVSRPSNAIVEAALRRLQRAVEAPAPTVRVQPPKKEPRPEPKIERRSEPKIERTVQQKVEPRIEPRIERRSDVPSQIVPDIKTLYQPGPKIEKQKVEPQPVMPPPPQTVVIPTSQVINEIATAPTRSFSATLEQEIELPIDEYSNSLTQAQYSRESLEYDYKADMDSSTSSRIDPDAQLDKLLHLGAEEFDDTARVGQRFVAAMVDIGIVLLATTPFAIALWILQVSFSDPRVLYVLSGLAVLSGFMYSVLSIGLVSRTVGMAFTGIHVMSLKNQKPPTLFQATARTIGHLFSAAPLALGFLWIVLGAERRAWHDMLSGTSVVRDY